MFGIPWLSVGLVKWGAIALAFVAMFAWVGVLKLEVNSAKKDAQKWETTYVTYKTGVEGKIIALGEANKALTLQSKEANIAQWKAQNELATNIREKVKNDKISRSIVIPASVLQLQHDTTVTHSADVSQPSSTGRDATPNTQQASVGDLLDADAINNPELNTCVDEVIAWNKFWDKFVSNVKANERVTTQ